MGREERWTVAGLLALAAVIYAVAWLFGGPATYLDRVSPAAERQPDAVAPHSTAGK